MLRAMLVEGDIMLQAVEWAITAIMGACCTLQYSLSFDEKFGGPRLVIIEALLWSWIREYVLSTNFGLTAGCGEWIYETIALMRDHATIDEVVQPLVNRINCDRDWAWVLIRNLANDLSDVMPKLYVCYHNYVSCVERSTSVNRTIEVMLGEDASDAAYLAWRDSPDVEQCNRAEYSLQSFIKQ